MLEDITKDVINKCIIEIKKKENKEKIENHLIVPIYKLVRKKLFPYISIVFFMYSVLLALNIVIIFLLKKNIK